MVEIIGKVYKEKVKGAKRVYRTIEGRRVEYYLVAEGKRKLKLLEDLSYIVASMEENELEMAYYLEGNYVYYFTFQEQENAFVVEREEVREGSEILELVIHHFRGFAPPKVEESLKELKKRYRDKRQLYVLGGIIGSFVILGILLKFALTPSSTSEPAQNQEPPPPPPPLSPEEVYKTGILFFQDLVDQINQIIISVKDEKIGEISYQDTSAQADKKDYVLKWTLYYSYPAPDTILEEVEGKRFWKIEESKTFTYTRAEIGKVETITGSYQCFEVILRSYPENTVVLSRLNGEDEIEVKDLKPSQMIELLNNLKSKNCPIYPEVLKISGKETNFKFKVREP